MVIRVIVQRDGEKVFDHVNASHIPFYVRNGYVVGAPWDTFFTPEKAKNLAQQGIAVIYDGDKKEIIFRLEE